MIFIFFQIFGIEMVPDRNEDIVDVHGDNGDEDEILL